MRVCRRAFFLFVADDDELLTPDDSGLAGGATASKDQVPRTGSGTETAAKSRGRHTQEYIRPASPPLSRSSRVY